MNHMKYARFIQAGWVMLLATLLLGLVVTPAGAASSTARQVTQRSGDATSVGATIYLTRGTLAPLFQSRIEQQVPGAVSSAINDIVSGLPRQDQGWALQMANTLIQPSATLTGLTTQPGGLVTSLQVSLYPGDPQPINISMLVSLSVLNSSTVQVSARPLNGGPALVSGPLATFQVPIGQLNSINTTPGCGDAALALRLQFPVALGNAQTQVQQDMALSAYTSTRGQSQSDPGMFRSTPSTNTSAYIELPASSLASMGNSVGDLPITSDMIAKNANIGVQGSNLLISADVYDSFLGKIGTATTTVAPTAAGGSLAVHVLSTTITFLNIFTFPYDSYNAQIQQTLNSKLNRALAGKFTVTRAAIGPNAHVPCAAGDSLVLTGVASLGSLGPA